MLKMLLLEKEGFCKSEIFKTKVFAKKAIKNGRRKSGFPEK